MSENDHTLGALLGAHDEEEFESYDLTEVKGVLQNLKLDAIDEGMALFLQQKTLRGADILSVYLARLIKTIAILEAKVTAAKNKASLDYKAVDGRTTADMKKYAGESDPGVEKLQIRLGRAKGAKQAIASKYEILLKSHHHFKDLALGYRQGNKMTTPGKPTSGWED